MSMQSQFTKFEEKIRLTWNDNKLKTIREKDDSIRCDIRQAFKDNGFPVIEFFQQGSYKTKTTIIPLDEDYDIDVAIVIDNEKAPDDPIDVKKVLEQVLIDRNFQNPKIKLPCVTAQYMKSGEKHFHLDYPIYKKEHGTYYLAIGKKNSSQDKKKWELSDPKGLIDYLCNVSDFADNIHYAQYKRLIKYIKRWRDYCIPIAENKYFYSIGIALMVKQSFSSSISYEGDINDIDSLKSTLKNILSNYFTVIGNDILGNPKYEISVKLPKAPYSEIFYKHGKKVGTLFYNKISKLIENLDKVDEIDGLKKKCSFLADKVFGEDFPIPEDDNRKFNESGYVASPQGA